jgi:hypothetical protein
MTDPVIDYCEIKFVKVAATTTDSSGGTVIPNGETVAVSRVRLSGAEPTAYASVVWDYGGGAEKTIASTRGDVDSKFDISNPGIQFTGDGVKAMKVVIENENVTQSPTIGGEYILTKVPS